MQYCKVVLNFARTLKKNGSSAVDDKMFLESRASSIPETYFRSGFVRLRFLESRKLSIRGTFYRQLQLIQKMYYCILFLWDFNFMRPKNLLKSTLSNIKGNRMLLLRYLKHRTGRQHISIIYIIINIFLIF